MDGCNRTGKKITLDDRMDGQGMIQKKSGSGSRTLAFVIYDKKVPFFPKMVLFQRISGKHIAKSALYLKIPDAAFKF